MSTTPFCTDIAIIGGGIAGLWMLNLLSDRGYSVVLLEKDALGSQQTLASQGMIHGGIKYTLQGTLSGASETIRDMPARWQDCLAGRGSIDLQAVERLSEDYFLFSDARLGSRVTAFFGSKAVAGRVDPVAREDFPTVFQDPAFRGQLYRLQDVVIDANSLVRHLADRYRERIFRAAPELIVGDDHSVSLRMAGTGDIKANRVLLTAGEGNGDLLRQAGSDITMQLRPLHQVIVEGDLPALYAHAVSLGTGDKPRMTVTTHPTAQARAWYLGGQLAESGVARTEEEQISFARAELGTLFPWIDFSQCQFSTLRINRAEPSSRDRSRPDTPFVGAHNNVIACWPTKLTLVPMMGDLVEPLLPAPAYPQPQIQAETASPGSAPWD